MSVASAQAAVGFEMMSVPLDSFFGLDYYGTTNLLTSTFSLCSLEVHLDPN